MKCIWRLIFTDFNPLEPFELMQTKLNCYLVDDDLQAIDALAHLLEKYCSEMVQVVGSTTSYDEALEYLLASEPELLFIDIKMEGDKGWDLIKKCGHLINTSVHIVTSTSEYAFEAYKLGVANYLLKPIDSGELIYSISRMYIKMQTFKLNSIQQFVKSKNEKIFIPDNKGWVRINIKEIVLLQSDSSYTHLIMENGDEHTITKHLGALEESLVDFQDFVRVSKSYIVNISHIVKIKKL